MSDPINVLEFIAAFDDGDQASTGNLAIEVHADAFTDAETESRKVSFIDNSDGNKRQTFSIRIDEVESFIGAVRRAAQIAKDS